MAIECSYTVKEATDGGYILKRCNETVKKPFHTLNTGVEFIQGLEAHIDNARCNEHYGSKNEPINGLDIDKIVEEYGTLCQPTGEGYVIKGGEDGA